MFIGGIEIRDEQNCLKFLELQGGLEGVVLTVTCGQAWEVTRTSPTTDVELTLRGVGHRKGHCADLAGTREDGMRREGDVSNPTLISCALSQAQACRHRGTCEGVIIALHFRGSILEA